MLSKIVLQIRVACHRLTLPTLLPIVPYSSWHTTCDTQNPWRYNFEIRPSGDSQSTQDLSDNICYFSNNEYYKELLKEKYFEMVSEQQDKYSFGRHSLTHNFKPNLPFILYWTYDSRALTYQSIKEIDSVDTDDFFKSEMNESKSIDDPVVMYFGEQAEVNVSKPVDTNTEYTLFTYLNNTRYYLTRGSQYDTDDDSERYKLALTSVKNRDMIKGDR